MKNVWYDFVYHVKWSSGSDGYFDAWVNGVKKLSYRGPTLYSGQGVLPQARQLPHGDWASELGHPRPHHPRHDGTLRFAGTFRRGFNAG